MRCVIFRLQCSRVDFTVCRDFAALSFIRVTAPLGEAGSALAGGAGFTLATALGRCRSELIERGIEQKLRTIGIRPVGIAAHPENLAYATDAAHFEAIENEVTRRMIEAREFCGRILWKSPSFTWALARLNPTPGYFSVIVARRADGARIIAYSARRGILATLMKTWEEYRNPLFFRVSADALKMYSKTGPLQGFSQTPFHVRLSRDPILAPSLDAFQIHRLECERHQIVYLTRKENT